MRDGPRGSGVAERSAHFGGISNSRCSSARRSSALLPIDKLSISAVQFAKKSNRALWPSKGAHTGEMT